MTIADAYSQWATRYDTDRNLTRDLDGVVTRRVIGLEPRPVVVEAGCGTGKNTRFFSAIAAHVHALDFSDGMLDVARRNAAAPNVRFMKADLCSDWPYPPCFANLVSFNLVLEHIKDIAGTMRHAVRILVPGGRIFISELHPFKQYQSSQAKFVNAQNVEVRIQASTHHISEYFCAATSCGLELVRFDEWWHADDAPDRVPRLVSFLFEWPT
jgi:ubiquinone/menaquinone biosynthesis C-methylase UbiE